MDFKCNVLRPSHCVQHGDYNSQSRDKCLNVCARVTIICFLGLTKLVGKKWFTTTYRNDGIGSCYGVSSFCRSGKLRPWHFHGTCICRRYIVWVWSRDIEDGLLKHMNTIRSSIKLTMEIASSPDPAFSTKEIGLAHSRPKSWAC